MTVVSTPSGGHTPPSPSVPTPPEARAEAQIGESGQPVRALAFAGGAFDTALQLGTIHALLVSQAKAPDVVVGVSAGAVNAVALAEVMQAGEEFTHDKKLSELERRRMRTQARVTRFREILEAFRRAPGEILDSLKPDTFQIDAHRPLKPLELPTHAEEERLGRQAALRSRSGLINLYNEILRLRLSIGTLTRAVRRVLGVSAAVEIRSPLRRWLVVTSELSRTWSLAGLNLHHLAPLVWPLLRPVVLAPAPESEGGSAGELIFHSRFWERVIRQARYGGSLVALVLVWLGVTVTIGLLPVALLRLGWVVLELAWPAVEAGAEFSWLWASVTLYGALLLGGLAIVRPGWRVARMAVLQLLNLALLTACGWVAVWLVLGAGYLAASDSLTLPPNATWWTAAGAALMHTGPWLLWGLLAVGGLGILATVAARWCATGGQYVRRLLESYDLADGLFASHPLRQLFVTIFDPGYYGDVKMDDAVDRALQDVTCPADVKLKGKLLREYCADDRSPKIHVGLAVADVSTGKLFTMPQDEKVVDGLIAAFALVPFFPPQRIGPTATRSQLVSAFFPPRRIGQVVVDGSNIANEPTRPLIDMLRHRVNPDSTVVQLYSVVSLPLSRRELGGSEGWYGSLVNVVSRALQLQRFRDATLERRLTELYTSTLPVGEKVLFITKSGKTKSGKRSDKRFLRVSVTPIEPQEPGHLNEELLNAATVDARRELIARTVADGCRAALEVMIRPSLGEAEQRGSMPCREAIGKHVAARLAKKRPRPAGAVGLPGSGDESGPGLVEVCSHCACRVPDGGGFGCAAPEERVKVTIAVRPWKNLPAWPLEHEDSQPRQGELNDVASKSDLARKALHSARGGGPASERAEGAWPRDGRRTRPLVSLLFSGGVFRGVYQMGVLNALSESGLRPDIIAGASVGSITAALVAEALSNMRQEARAARIGRLAATFLALDRLILTDRFVDFIRNFTLRAAATRFSLRDADRFFRRYDSADPRRFNREARLVVAGLERLFYLSPFELRDLAKALRDRRADTVAKLLGRHVTEWLERMGVGDQILGAEPLARLINEHVLKRLNRDAGSVTPFQAFLKDQAFLKESGVYFLATATNLTKGRLEILGARQEGSERDTVYDTVLLDGLLASSAFPAVFRPRSSWEVIPGSRSEQQYIDGGVMDNLPLDAVAQFLYKASLNDRITARPKFKGKPVPHLLFAASLEPVIPKLDQGQVDALCADWPTLLGRTRKLGYNKKLDDFQETQRALREIYETPEYQQRPSWTPLDLEVVAVRPNWLCGTFAFHPMLGFRRAKQAASIAHGCASTLMELAKLKPAPIRGGGPDDGGAERVAWASAWGINLDNLPKPPRDDDPPARLFQPDPKADASREDCWFRPGVPCTFAASQLRRASANVGDKLSEHTIREVDRIYRACGKLETHLPR